MIFDMDNAKYMLDIGARMLIHAADIVYYKQAYQKVLEDYSDLR